MSSRVNIVHMDSNLLTSGTKITVLEILNAFIEAERWN